MSQFPEFDPLRKQLSRLTALSLFGIALAYWHGMRPDMGAVLAFAIPALLLSVMVALRRPAAANLIAGVFALGWFSHGIMVAFVESDHRVWALIVALLSLVVVLAVSWVGLKVRKAKRNL